MDYKKLKSCLQTSIEKCNKVVITSHNRLDIDGLASAIGLYNIAKVMEKEAYIVIDDISSTIEPGVKKILEDVCFNTTICNSQDLKEIDQNTLLITTDVNKKNRICIERYLNLFKNIIIIDHHAKDLNTIDTPNLFTDENISSACEIVTYLLQMFNVQLSQPNLYSYLYAGIVLDTKNFTKGVITNNTFNTCSYLLNQGASILVSNSLFMQTFDDDRRFQRLVDQADFQNHKIALAMDKDKPSTIYKQEDMAKAADYLMQFNNDASFALGFIAPELVSISARSLGDINVEKIMQYYGGGGSYCSAATQIKTSDINDVYRDLNNRLRADRPAALEYVRNINIRR